MAKIKWTIIVEQEFNQENYKELEKHVNGVKEAILYEQEAYDEGRYSILDILNYGDPKVSIEAIE